MEIIQFTVWRFDDFSGTIIQYRVSERCGICVIFINEWVCECCKRLKPLQIRKNENQNEFHTPQIWKHASDYRYRIQFRNTTILHQHEINFRRKIKMSVLILGRNFQNQQSTEHYVGIGRIQLRKRFRKITPILKNVSGSKRRLCRYGNFFVIPIRNRVKKDTRLPWSVLQIPIFLL